MAGPGDLLANKIRLVRRLGAGGMGVVYEGRHLHLGRRVAVKLIHAQEASSLEARTRFLREARAQASLPLEHIVQVLDVDTLPDGTLYTVMEYLDGHDLKRELKKRGPLPIAEAAFYVAQACRGAAAAHAAGIVHRDIKPQNLFITNLEGQRKVKLLDFGIAKFFRDVSQDLTATDEVVGTPTHLSPEQIGAHAVDGRADIWALGIVLFELLSGETPFRRATALATLGAIANDNPPLLSRLRPDVPPGLQEVVEHCLAKSADERYQTAAELEQALSPFSSFDGHVRASLRPPRGSSLPAPELQEAEPAPLIVPPLARAPLVLDTASLEAPPMPSAAATGREPAAAPAPLARRVFSASASTQMGDAAPLRLAKLGLGVLVVVLAASFLFLGKRPRPAPPSLTSAAHPSSPALPAPSEQREVAIEAPRATSAPESEARTSNTADAARVEGATAVPARRAGKAIPVPRPSASTSGSKPPLNDNRPDMVPLHL